MRQAGPPAESQRPSSMGPNSAGVDVAIGRAVDMLFGDASAFEHVAKRWASRRDAATTATAAVRDGPSAERASTSSSLEALVVEKRRLKDYLRGADAALAKRYGRAPTQAEKEHLRPTYAQYWRVKRLIASVTASSGEDGRGELVRATRTPEIAVAS